MISDLVTWTTMVDTEVLDPRRETLVQPEMGPPFHCCDISKPHVCQLMTHYQSDLELQEDQVNDEIYAAQ